MTKRNDLSASGPEARAAAEETRRLLARSGIKARDDDEATDTGKKLEELATRPGRDDDTDDALDDAIDPKERDDEEDDEDEADRDDEEREDEEEDADAGKRAGRRGRKAAVRAAVVEDRARAAKVMELARAAGLPNFGQRHVGYGTSIREFRRALHERQGKPGGRPVGAQPTFAKEAATGAREARRALGRK